MIDLRGRSRSPLFIYLRVGGSGPDLAAASATSQGRSGDVHGQAGWEKHPRIGTRAAHEAHMQASAANASMHTVRARMRSC
jgi:hypothetical protein